MRTMMALPFIALLVGCPSHHNADPNPPVTVTTLGLVSGAKDNVLFTGDSITWRGMSRMYLPGYAECVSAISMDPTHYPGYVDVAIGGTISTDALLTLDAFLAQYPNANYVTLAYGTNDLASVRGEAVSTFQAAMQALITKVVNAGMIPVIPTIPYSTNPEYSTQPDFNLAIAQLNAANHLMPGPDLYTWFKAHPDELSSDGIHPAPVGYVSLNILWAAAMLKIYAAHP